MKLLSNAYKVKQNYIDELSNQIPVHKDTWHIYPIK